VFAQHAGFVVGFDFTLGRGGHHRGRMMFVKKIIVPKLNADCGAVSNPFVLPFLGAARMSVVFFVSNKKRNSS
jgi:hypothetical protein